MAKSERDASFLPLKLMFESGNVKKMRDIEKIYPTLVASNMPMNHSRYINKLYKPETLTMKQVIRLAEIIDVHPKIISDIVLDELMTKKKRK